MMTIELLRERAGPRGATKRLSTATRTAYAAPDAPRAKDAPKPARQNAPEDTPTDTGQVVVLIAEDEETIAETLAMIVEDAGYEPMVAHDGREALALAQQHHPHLIITDLMMPYLNGADLIAAVRGDAASQGLAPPPMLVVTAASSARAEEAGADAVVAKPFDVPKLERIMERLLRGDFR